MDINDPRQKRRIEILHVVFLREPTRPNEYGH